MSLTKALGFSAAFHVILLAAAPTRAFVTPQRRFEVTYIAARPAPATNVKPASAPPVFQPRLPEPEPAPPPAIPAPAVSESQQPPLPDAAPAPVARPVNRPLTKEDVPAPAPRPAISSLPDKEFVFLDHKEKVRKHLKARLNYPAVMSDGSVRIRVILGPEGSFKQAVVLETSDPRLAGLAVKDAQSAAPYPRLPAKFRPRQLRYEFLVRYRPE